MARIIILFLLFSIQPAQEQRIDIIFVSPPNEVFTDEEKKYTIESVQNAVSFWNKEYDIHTQDLTIDSNPYTVTMDQWCQCNIFTAEVSIRLFIIDNSESKALLFNHYAGYAQNYLQIGVLVLDSSPVELAAQIAHELGHIFYNLDDMYTIHGMCNQIDIMCYPQSAYSQRFIGCLTLAYIGAPCNTIHLPGVYNE